MATSIANDAVPAVSHKGEHLTTPMDDEKGPIGTGASSVAEMEIDPIEERKLVRYQDLTIMPLVILAYFLLFLDRSNMSNANTAGLSKSLGLSPLDYNIGGSVYFITYIIVENCGGLIVKRFGNIIVPIFVILFGICTLGTTWIHNRGSFFAVRALLGITEGIGQPGIAYMLSRWYRRREITLRIGLFMLVAASLSQAFGSLIAAGLLARGDIGSITGWRKIFLVEGILTIGCGIFMCAVWPADPEKSRMVQGPRRDLAIARIMVDSRGAKVATEKTTWKLVWSAIKTPTNLVLIWCYICDNVVMQGLALFAPTILRTNYPGKTTVQINLLAAPLHITSGAIALLLTWLDIKYQIHYISVSFGGICGIAGYGAWLATTNSNVRYGAMYLVGAAGYINGPNVLGWALSNSTPATHRAVTAALIPGVGAIGSIISPWTYVSSTAPGYKPGNSLNLSMQISVVFCALGLAFWQMQENKKRDRGEYDYRLDQPGVEYLGYKHPEFRYIH